MAVTCPYCGTKIPLAKPEPEQALVMEFLVQVGVDKTALTGLAHGLMSAPDNAPDDILEKSQIEEAGFYYVPCYMGQGKFDYNWTASFGFDREEAYTDYDTVTDRDGRTEQVAVTRYRTVTDWRPASGNGVARFLRLACAADPSAISRQVGEMLEESVPYTPIAYNINLMGGYPSLDFAYSPEQGASALESLVINKDAPSFAHKKAQGDHQQDWSIDAVVTFDGPVKAGLIPLAKFVYSYGGKNYVIWAEGTKLSSYIVEGAPIDKSRGTDKSQGYIPMWVTLGSIALTVVLALTEVMPELEFTPFIYASVGTFLFSLGYGALRSVSISNFSKALREATFWGKRLELTDNSGSPLPDEERRDLLEKSRPPEKPFLAKTDNDKIILPILSVLCALAIALAVFFGINEYDLDFFGGSDYSAYSTDDGQSEDPVGENQTAGAASEGQNAGAVGENQSSGLASEGQSQDSSATAASQTTPDQPGRGFYNQDEISCSGSPEICQVSGTPVNGLVYELRDLSDEPSAYKFVSLVTFSDGRVDGPVVYFESNGDFSYASSRLNDNQSLMVTYYPKENGNRQKTKHVAELKDDDIDGDFFSYDSEGNLSYVSKYVNGELHGESIDYYPDGSVSAKTLYDRGSSKENQSYQPGELVEPLPVFSQNDFLHETLKKVDEMLPQIPNNS
jgi:hypothetical protein